MKAISKTNVTAYGSEVFQAYLKFTAMVRFTCQHSLEPPVKCEVVIRI